MAGYTVINIKSGPDGCVDKEALKNALSERTAVVMLTVPNTVGLFEKDIRQIADMVHAAGSAFIHGRGQLQRADRRGETRVFRH